MKQRLLVNSVILVTFFLLPWWFGALFALASLFLIKNFWEIILWGFFFDVFYGLHGNTHNTLYWGTLIAIILYLLSLPIRKRISIS
jgi:hypothetical protein